MSLALLLALFVAFADEQAPEPDDRPPSPTDRSTREESSLAPAAPYDDLRIWTDTAIEGRPNEFTGEPYLTAAQRAGVNYTFRRGFRIEGSGDLRLREPAVPARGFVRLWRAYVEHRGGAHHLQMGRHTRIGPRGLQRLDGASMAWDAGEMISVESWAGRLWSPETWDVQANGAGTWSVGALTHFRPEGWRSPFRSLRASVGFEARFADEDGFQPEGFVSAGYHDTRGDSVVATVQVRGVGMEGDDPDADVRAIVRARGKVTQKMWLTGRAAWEGLKPFYVPQSVSSPYDFLTRQGYGLAGGGLNWQQDAWRVDVDLMGSLHDELEGVQPGGMARGLVSWQDGGGMSAGGFLQTAAIGGSWITGGGAEYRIQRQIWQLRVDTGLYAMRGIDQALAPVWELRARGRFDVFDKNASRLRHMLHLAWDAAGGTNRNLIPWFRCGVALQYRAAREDAP